MSVLKSLLTIGIILLLFFGVLSWYLSYTFERDCEDWLKLAGDASELETASEFLTKAITYMDKHDLTSGNSGILFEPPVDDIGVWYRQVTEAQNILVKFLAKIEEKPSLDTDQEKSLILNKMRQTLLDDSQGSTVVTTPTWISWYPHEAKMCWWFYLSILFIIIGAIAVGVDSY